MGDLAGDVTMIECRLPYECPRCHGTGYKHMKRGQKRRMYCPYCGGIGWTKYKGTAYERWRGSKK